MQKVWVTISELPITAADVASYFEPEEWESARQDDVSLEEVRRAPASIPGSPADAVVASRDER